MERKRIQSMHFIIHDIGKPVQVFC